MHHALARPSDPENPSFCQLFVPRVAVVATIEDHHAARREREGVGDVHFGLQATADLGKSRDQAVMVQPRMQLEGGLLRRDVRPGKDLRRQIYQRAIQGDQLALEPEALARHGTTGLQSRVQQPEEFLEEVGVELLVLPRKAERLTERLLR